jgi:hypothetical protein
MIETYDLARALRERRDVPEKMFHLPVACGMRRGMPAAIHHHRSGMAAEGVVIDAEEYS